jgi:hypothetical protein
MSQIITVDELLKKTPQELAFYQKILVHDIDENGNDKGVLKRMLSSPTCIKCHEQYKEKFPGVAFNIQCEGIYEDPELHEKHDRMVESGILVDFETIKEIYNPAFWTSRHVVTKDAHGDIVPFIPRWYQAESMRCTARYIVDRYSRGLGKTSSAVAKELWMALVNKNKYTMVVYPNEAQSSTFFNELVFQRDNSPSIAKMWKGQIQKPFYKVRFQNGSVIGIFTAGSSSGKAAKGIRGQDPSRVRLDEQDYLSDADYDAIIPLFTRHANSSFHGSSTPTGARTVYWYMCKKDTAYREFYFPLTVHPEYSAEFEAQCMDQAKTADRFRHEYLAEFSDPSAGVFKSMFIEAAMATAYTYNSCYYNSAKSYFMGVDWNGKGTGTRIRIVEYDPVTKMRKVVASVTVDNEGTRTIDSINAIIELNKKWHCEAVYIDAGYGAAQDEMLRLAGSQATDPDTKRLKDIRVIDSGGKLEFNKLVVNRTGRPRIDDETTLERRTKPFIVDTAVMTFESNLIQFSPDDALLEEQLRGYRVATWSKADQANTFSTDSDSGDHDLDAFMLALLGVEQKYGLFRDQQVMQRLAQVAFSGGFGVPNIQNSSTTPRDLMKQKAGVQSRSVPSGSNDNFRLLYMVKGGFIGAPRASSSQSNSSVPSRTSAFNNKKGKR